jgi:hypothetical protein
LNSSRPIGSQASGDTGLEHGDDRRRHVGEELEAPDHEAERDADQRGQAEADADALERDSTFQPMPWSFGP